MNKCPLPTFLLPRIGQGIDALAQDPSNFGEMIAAPGELADLGPMNLTNS